MRQKEYKITTVKDTNATILMKKAELIKTSELDLAREIVTALEATLKNMNSPAAGLAAPQIGITKAIFICTYDRNLSHLKAVINPKILSVSAEEVLGWEACFSAKFPEGSRTAAYIARHKEIAARYMDLSGNLVEVQLGGFAAKVFQHEYDHLQGIVNIYHPSVIECKDFENDIQFEEFMQEVRRADAKTYSS